MDNRSQMTVRKGEEGSYLLEVLIAVFLFGLAMLGLAQLGYASMVGNRTSQAMTDATALAQERLEDVRNVGFVKADSLAVKEDYGAVASFPKFKRITSVTLMGGGNMKQITVRVYWDGDKHSFALQTALSSR